MPDLPPRDESADNPPWRRALERQLRTYLMECASEPHGLLDMVVGDVEQLVIRVILDHCHNNQTRAARMLGISRSTLRGRLGLNK